MIWATAMWPEADSSEGARADTAPPLTLGLVQSAHRYD